ncbi:MAG: hypothetical protein RIC55_22530 [Pirellulaceae bacterium]
MTRQAWIKTAAVWLLLGASMALGTAVTEVVIHLTGAWPPELPKHLVNFDDASTSQQAPFASCFAAASRRR